MSERRNMGCIPMLVMIVLIGSVLAGAAWFIKQQYKAKQKTIKKAIAELPEFDEVAARKYAEEKLGTAPSPVLMSVEDIKIKADEAAKLLTQKKYPASLLNRQQAAILKKYKSLKNGMPIKIFNATTGRYITGIYQGTFRDAQGGYFKVNGVTYRLSDIAKEQLYLVVPEVANLRAKQELKNLKESFLRNREQYLEKVKKYKLKDLYVNAGYVLENEEWKDKSIWYHEQINKIVNEQKAKFEEDKRRKQAEILQRNKLFDIIDISMSEENKQ